MVAGTFNSTLSHYSKLYTLNSTLSSINYKLSTINFNNGLLLKMAGFPIMIRCSCALVMATFSLRSISLPSSMNVLLVRKRS